MPDKKYTEQNIKEWVEYYNIVLCISEVARNFDIHKSVISKYFKLYGNKFGLKYKYEIQKELLSQNKRFCLPTTGCGKIKAIDQFYFRKDIDKYKEQCNNCRSKYSKKWNKNNKEYLSIYNKKYGKRNRKQISFNEKQRKQNDIQFRLIKNIRARTSNALNGRIKLATAKEYLGCSPEKLKKHLENKFYPHPQTGEQMTWDNYGLYGWHIDHIKPLASFDLTDKKHLLNAGHYTNLQPLWAEENFAKGNK